MVDTLQCDEVFRLPSTPPLIRREREAYHETIPQFCKAYKDTTILRDIRVFQNLLRLEGHYVPSLDHYVTLQDEIKIHMRKIVVDWMLDVCIDQQCHVDVFLLAANIMDRFLDTIRLQKNQFQLLGAAAIFLASKLVEPTPVSAINLVKYTADTYNRDELLSMELLILSKLKWDLTAVTAYDYLDHLLEQAETLRHSIDLENLRRHTERFITLCATNIQFLRLPASVIASAAFANALQHDSGNSNTEVVNRVMAMIPYNACLQQCIQQIEELYIGHSDRRTETPAFPPSASPAMTTSSSSMLTSTPTRDVVAIEVRVQSVVTPTSGATPTVPKTPPSQANASFDSGICTSPDCGNPDSPKTAHLKNLRDTKPDTRDTDSDRESDNATPTKVFNVSAFYVT